MRYKRNIRQYLIAPCTKCALDGAFCTDMFVFLLTFKKASKRAIKRV
jgi:hypothetical protein